MQLFGQRGNSTIPYGSYEHRLLQDPWRLWNGLEEPTIEGRSSEGWTSGDEESDVEYSESFQEEWGMYEDSLDDDSSEEEDYSDDDSDSESDSEWETADEEELS